MLLAALCCRRAQAGLAVGFHPEKVQAGAGMWGAGGKENDVPSGREGRNS